MSVTVERKTADGGYHIRGDGWSMQPEGTINVGEARRICELAADAINATAAPAAQPGEICQNPPVSSADPLDPSKLIELKVISSPVYGNGKQGIRFEPIGHFEGNRYFVLVGKPMKLPKPGQPGFT